MDGFRPRSVSHDIFRENEMNRGIIGAAIIGMVAIALIFGSWYTVDQTERGVILRNGAAEASSFKLVT